MLSPNYIGGKVSVLDKIKIDARQRLEQLSSQYLSLSKQAATSNATLQLTLEAIPRSRKRTSDIQGFLRVNLKCVGFTNQNDLRLSLQREVDQILAKGSVPTPPPTPQPTSSSACVSVDSRSGWQHFNLPGSFTRVTNISGGWSVDTRNYSSVGPYGHSGRDAESLAPYNQYKFDQSFPFGALLMGSGQGRLWIQSPISFNGSFGAVDMRINDADNALGDNGGSLQVCFGN
ncbi:hypothetical protein [Nostoc sp.]